MKKLIFLFLLALAHANEMHLKDSDLILDTSAKTNLDLRNQIKLQKRAYEAQEDIKALLKDKSLESKISLKHYSFINEKNLDSHKYSAFSKIYDDADKRSGFFIGAGVGFASIFTGNALETTIIRPFLVNLRGGYQAVFNEYFGSRLYGGIAFSAPLATLNVYNIRTGIARPVANPLDSFKSAKTLYALGTLNADLLFEFPLSYNYNTYIGGFLGLGVGAMYYQSFIDSKSSLQSFDYIWSHIIQVDYSFNVGVSLTFLHKNRVEIALNTPFSFLELPGLSKSANIFELTPAKFWRGALFSLSYNFVF